MLPSLSPLTALQNALAEGALTPVDIAEDVIAHANGNASQNTYTHLDPAALLREAAALQPGGELYAVPISLKDLFDLAGTVTSAGTRFYAGHNPPATSDSAVASALKQAGCLIPGKTHLHPLAYGVTGQNPDFGDCLQPRDPTLLTGGSSSGAAASVQEGSALAAIGTDTGGSVRIPAALCGLVGFRASRSITTFFPELWRGGMHLAPLLRHHRPAPARPPRHRPHRPGALPHPSRPGARSPAHRLCRRSLPRRRQPRRPRGLCRLEAAPRARRRHPRRLRARRLAGLARDLLRHRRPRIRPDPSPPHGSV